MSVENYKHNYRSGAWKSPEAAIGLGTLAVSVASLAIAVAALCFHHFGAPSLLRQPLSHVNLRGLTILSGSLAVATLPITTLFLSRVRQNELDFKKTFHKNFEESQLRELVGQFEQGGREHYEFRKYLGSEYIKLEITKGRFDISKA